MIKIKNSILGVGLAFASLTTFTGCIDETQPTDIATSEQVSQSAAAVEGLVMAMPAFFNNLNETFYTPNNYHFNFGYGSMIRIRATLTGLRHGQRMRVSTRMQPVQTSSGHTTTSSSRQPITFSLLSMRRLLLMSRRVTLQLPRLSVRSLISTSVVCTSTCQQMLQRV